MNKPSPTSDTANSVSASSDNTNKATKPSSKGSKLWAPKENNVATSPAKKCKASRKPGTIGGYFSTLSDKIEKDIKFVLDNAPDMTNKLIGIRLCCDEVTGGGCVRVYGSLLLVTVCSAGFFNVLDGNRDFVFFT